MREGLVLDLEGRVPPKVPIDGCLLSDGPVLQLSFIWKIKENTFSRREGMLTQKTPFHTVHGVLEAKILEWFAIPSSQWTMYCENTPL